MIFSTFYSSCLFMRIGSREEFKYLLEIRILWFDFSSFFLFIFINFLDDEETYDHGYIIL